LPLIGSKMTSLGGEKTKKKRRKRERKAVPIQTFVDMLTSKKDKGGEMHRLLQPTPRPPLVTLARSSFLFWSSEVKSRLTSPHARKRATCG